jgi:hypothetical protein
MKKVRVILMVGVLGVLLVACGSAIKRGTAQQWLDTQGQGSKHNVSGSWKGPEGGYGYSYWGGVYSASYGTIVLVQEGSKLSGTYNEYEIIGRITGDQVFLVGLYGEDVYYTWFMRYVPEANSMIGKMCEGYTTQVQDYCTPLTLEKGK